MPIARLFRPSRFVLPDFVPAPLEWESPDELVLTDIAACLALLPDGRTPVTAQTPGELHARVTEHLKLVASSPAAPAPVDDLCSALADLKRLIA